MNLQIPTHDEENPILELGDIIYSHETKLSYIVVSQLDDESKIQYVAKGLNGSSGLFGRYDTLRELNTEFVEDGLHKECTVYKHTEYELKLVKKGED